MGDGDRHDLVLVARGEGKLREIGDQLEAPHGITAAVIAADLSAPNAARDLVDTLRAGSIEVDVLVNNASIGLSGAFLDCTNGPPTASAVTERPRPFHAVPRGPASGGGKSEGNPGPPSSEPCGIQAQASGLISIS